ncbi:hypothetical protein L227DRAFT_614607 [Lentinus tigrinus ALCF2SS1-6]|uniref:Uncharacterized protein n=1 Tax=Lentinus tigrinus ALCF2SS1-6 TaxID=1328759 RepID=A0A5C2RZG7_9APHY|nr:hypothetical protein L227DRAFT_614607 [Lentinus tigrinus ALCF2SS1-6]
MLHRTRPSTGRDLWLRRRIRSHELCMFMPYVYSGGLQFIFQYAAPTPESHALLRSATRLVFNVNP